MTAARRPASVRSALTADAIAEALLDNLHYLVARTPQQATRNDWYMALAYTVRDRLLTATSTPWRRSRRGSAP